MTAPDWKSWTDAEKAELLKQLQYQRELKSYEWKCNRSNCDGLPHTDPAVGPPHNHARGDQRAPDGDWDIWLALTGRGWGKTWTGAHWIRDAVESDPGEYALVAHKYGDCRDVMVEGPSGLLRAIPPSDIVSYNRSLGEIIHVNGSKIHMLEASNRDTARGLNLRGAWCDEIVKWRYIESFTEGLQPAVRVGDRPRIFISTTPKPVPLIKMLIKQAEGMKVHITRGSTFDNIANLNQHAVSRLRAQYTGTRLGRQELYGELLEDVEGAYFTYSNLESNRLSKELFRADYAGTIVRRVVAVDPAVTSTEKSDETGIIVCSRDQRGHGYVEADYSITAHPEKWARRVIQAYDEKQADRVIVEVNQGGDMVSQLLRTIRPTIPITPVRAKQGKHLRAEPIASLYEQGMIHHVGTHEKLEEQMCTWTPNDKESPDRLDALVWGFTELMQHSGAQRYLAALASICFSCNYPSVKGAVVCFKCGASLGEAG